MGVNEGNDGTNFSSSLHTNGITRLHNVPSIETSRLLDPQRNAHSESYVLVLPGTESKKADDATKEDGEGDAGDFSGGRTR